jgi:hypothetical protein
MRWLLTLIAAVLLLGADSTERQERLTRFRAALPFVEGYDPGVERARFRGMPPMFFYADPEGVYDLRLAQTAFVDPESRERILGHFTPVWIDAGADAAFAERYGLEGHPFTIFLDHDGNLLARVRGFVSLAVFRRALTRAAGKVGEPRPSEDWKAQRALVETLRKQLGAGETAKAIATILEMEKEHVADLFLEEALRAKSALEKDAARQLARARSFIIEGNDDAAEAILERVSEKYAGLDAAREADDLIEALPDRG